MNLTLSNLAYLMLVFVPYLILTVYTMFIYPDLPDKLGVGLPRAFIFLPVLIAAILPITFAVMIFFFSHYLKKAHYLTIAAFMDLGLLGLIGAVYLIKDSS